MPDKILINEVGLRDGLQMQPTFVPTARKLELAVALRDAGIRSFELSSFVSPKAVPQMADAADVFAGVPPADDTAYWALVANERGYDRAVAAGAKHIALVLSVTDTMNRKNINKTVAESAAEYAGLLARCAADGIANRVYLSAAFACPYEGTVPAEVVIDWTDKMLAAGAAEIVVSDTIGAGTPAQCEHLLTRLLDRWPPATFALHLHDTRAMALTLAWIGVQHGLRKFDSSIGGLGGCPFAPGAAGNVATEDLVFMFNESGFDTGIDIAGLRDAVRLAGDITGLDLGGRITNYLKSKEPAS